jgi:N-acetylglucosaminyldiphosphoundecaprenol N-acetyl-beta-D-mannosaminyltransferase
MTSDSAHQAFHGFPVREVAGIPFVVGSLEEATQWLVFEAAVKRFAVNVRLANAYNVALADSDPRYGDLLMNQGLNFPDGTPVVWYMNRRLGAGRRAGRVRGPSLFSATMALSAGTDIRHFFLGATDATLEALEGALRDSFPDLKVAGSYAPPFAPVDDSFITECERAIRGAKPDIVWVGLGTPKQDLVGSALAKRIGIPTVNVGAAFDFAAGTAREAPVWIQNSGFEWLFRLVSEPKRLWRRYVFGNARFLYAATRFEREGSVPTQ